MNKLELKHIAPYLPYGLRWRFEGEDITHEVVGLDIINTGVKLISPYYNYGSCEINNGRPLLRLMSDLYKEINGEAGIVELAKMCEYPYSTAKWEIEENKCVAETDTFIYEFWIADYIPFVTEYAKNIFGKVLNETTTQAFSPMMLLEYLFANHYDVFGLIEQGLAIKKESEVLNE